MKLPCECEVEKVASKQVGRRTISEPYLDTSEKGKPVLVATDGCMIVAVPVELEEGDEPGYVTGEALKLSRKLWRKFRDMSLKAAAQALSLVEAPGVSGPTFPRPTDAAMGSFPSWRKICPQPDQKEIRLSFDVERLELLLKAMGGGIGNGAQLVLHIAVDEEGQPLYGAPMRVVGKRADVLGLLMPCRL